MHTVDKETVAAGVSYPISFQQFDGLEEAVAAIGNCTADEVVIEAPQGAKDSALGVINAAQEQGAKQGGKEDVRKAVEKNGADSPEAAESVASHQKRAAKYVIGAPRGSGPGGMTKTKAGDLGKALLESLGAEALKALAAEQGIDPELLG